MIIRLQNCPTQPWKNGLGRTRELAVHPAGARSDDFLWRVSIAEVDSDAPFSVFSGIDRQIALLDGDGFIMRLDDERTHALIQPLVPFAFPGEANVSVTLVGGPTRDFNLMVRRDRAHAHIRLWHGGDTHPLEKNLALIFCARGRIDTAEAQMHDGDAWCPSSHDTKVILHDGALALAVFVDLRVA